MCKHSTKKVLGQLCGLQYCVWNEFLVIFFICMGWGNGNEGELGRNLTEFFSLCLDFYFPVMSLPLIPLYLLTTLKGTAISLCI